jgi:hypothetical protein
MANIVGAMPFITHVLVAVAQVPPSESRERLEMFVGSWTIPGQENSYSEICEWYHNRSFIVCNTEEKRPQGVSKSVSVLGFSELSGMYTYYSFGSSGGSRLLNGFLRGDEWLFTGERPVRGDMVRSQVSIKPTTSGFAFREERSTNGAPWIVAARVDYIRRK